MRLSYAEPLDAVLVQPAATSSLVTIFSNGCDAHLEATYPASAGASPGDKVTTVAQLSFAGPFASFAKQ